MVEGVEAQAGRVLEAGGVSVATGELPEYCSIVEARQHGGRGVSPMLPLNLVHAAAAIDDVQVLMMMYRLPASSMHMILLP